MAGFFLDDAAQFSQPPARQLASELGEFIGSILVTFPMNPIAESLQRKNRLAAPHKICISDRQRLINGRSKQRIDMPGYPISPSAKQSISQVRQVPAHQLAKIMDEQISVLNDPFFQIGELGGPDVSGGVDL